MAENDLSQLFNTMANFYNIVDEPNRRREEREQQRILQDDQQEFQREIVQLNTLAQERSQALERLGVARQKAVESGAILGNDDFLKLTDFSIEGHSKGLQDVYSALANVEGRLAANVAGEQAVGVLAGFDEELNEETAASTLENFVFEANADILKDKDEAYIQNFQAGVREKLPQYLEMIRMRKGFKREDAETALVRDQSGNVKANTAKTKSEVENSLLLTTAQVANLISSANERDVTSAEAASKLKLEMKSAYDATEWAYIQKAMPGFDALGFFSRKQEPTPENSKLVSNQEKQIDEAIDRAKTAAKKAFVTPDDRFNQILEKYGQQLKQGNKEAFAKLLIEASEDTPDARWKAYTIGAGMAGAKSQIPNTTVDNDAKVLARILMNEFGMTEDGRLLFTEGKRYSDGTEVVGYKSVNRSKSSLESSSMGLNNNTFDNFKRVHSNRMNGIVERLRLIDVGAQNGRQ